MSKNQLFAGAGAAAIRFPQEIFPLESFQGVHDEPHARVLLLECGLRTAIVCMELVMLPDEEIALLRRMIGELTGTPEEHIWVHVTHAITTPHAPHAPKGMGGVDLEISEEERRTLDRKIGLFNAAVEDAVGCAARAAAASFRPARMGVGAGECHVNMNRDISTPFGWWINFAPDGPSNHTATILKFEDEAGAAIGALISYGLKPCAIDNSEMGRDTRLISSDVPGLACTLLEEKLGAPCLFAMSAAGDQVPLEQAWYAVVNDDGTVSEVDLGVQAGLEMVDRLGRRMAQELEPVLTGTVCDQTAPEIRMDQGGIEWQGKERCQMKPTKKAEYVPKGSYRLNAHVMALGDVALVAVKPEVNTVTEAQLHAASPFAHTLLMSMVNGGFKYMPDLASYENSTWEAQNCALMPGAAEAWVAQAADVLERVRGR